MILLPIRSAAHTQSPMPRREKAAVSLGRRGAAKRNRNMTPEQRSESARNAANARWSRKAKSPTGFSHAAKLQDSGEIPE